MAEGAGLQDLQEGEVGLHPSGDQVQGEGQELPLEVGLEAKMVDQLNSLCSETDY